MCQCDGCKGKNEKRYFLQFRKLKKGKRKDYVEARIKGLFFFSSEVKVRIKDMENCFKNLKKEKIKND